MTIHTSFVPERVVPDELGHSNGVESQGSLYPTRSAFARVYERERKTRSVSLFGDHIFEILVLVIVPSRVMYSSSLVTASVLFLPRRLRHVQSMIDLQKQCNINQSYAGAQPEHLNMHLLLALYKH